MTSSANDKHASLMFVAEIFDGVAVWAGFWDGSPPKTIVSQIGSCHGIRTWHITH
jgi:hypothetical protein